MLDPCEDENDDMVEDEVSLEVESLHQSDFSNSKNEVNLQYSFNDLSEFEWWEFEVMWVISLIFGASEFILNSG